MSRDAADATIEGEMRRLRQVTADAQGIARDAVAQSKELRDRLERDQALLAKEQGRWWPHPWQAALGLLGALYLCLVALLVSHVLAGDWFGVVFDVVFLVSGAALLIGGRRG